MRVVAIYRFTSEQARSVTEFVEMMRRRYPDRVVLELDIETRAGAAEAALYDIVAYPAIIVTAYDGRIVNMWQGLPLPLIDEVAAFTLEQQSVQV